MPSYSLVLEVVWVGVFARRKLIACMSSPGREGSGIGGEGRWEYGGGCRSALRKGEGCSASICKNASIRKTPANV